MRVLSMKKSVEIVQGCLQLTFGKGNSLDTSIFKHSFYADYTQFFLIVEILVLKGNKLFSVCISE